MKSRDRDNDRLTRLERRFRELAADLTDIGYLWPGSLSRRLLTCGKASCGCHKDEAKRHGPYPYWTSKLKGRTVSRLVPADEAELLETWIGNRQRLEQITREMMAVCKKIAPLVLSARAASREGRAAGRSRAKRAETRRGPAA